MSDIKVCIVDYGLGNHQSVVNALSFLGYDCSVSGRESDMAKADVLILPGVGSFAEGMKNIRQAGLELILKDQVLEKKKLFLGICLGMQLLADDSLENGHHKGLGWIKGSVIKLEGSDKVRVPHVGWNSLDIRQKDPFFNLSDARANYYFDHSYHYQCSDEFVSAYTSVGSNIAAAIQKGNIFGVQFHPEKSHNNGLKLLRSFFNGAEAKRMSHA